MPIIMTVHSLAVDPTTKSPFVVLQDEAKKHALPIWIGMAEASAIATELERIKLGRPMTHDLLKAVMEALGGKLVQVEIVDLRENTYIASLLIQNASNENVTLDARPSDAIALALRTGSEIQVHEKVLTKAGTDAQTQTPPAFSPDEPDKWEKVLENLPSEAFGKYKM